VRAGAKPANRKQNPLSREKRNDDNNLQQSNAREQLARGRCRFKGVI
jgi:hypothetical protein